MASVILQNSWLLHFPVRFGRRPECSCFDFVINVCQIKRGDICDEIDKLLSSYWIEPSTCTFGHSAGMNQAGLAECIVRAVNSCHVYLHPVLYERYVRDFIWLGFLNQFCKILFRELFLAKNLK